MAYGTSYSTEELMNLVTRDVYVKEIGTEIQEKLGFEIPFYIIEEIALAKENIDKLRVGILINIAELNNKITEEQSRKLKQIYCK